MIADVKNAMVLYPFQLISDTVKLSCSTNQPIEMRAPGAEFPGEAQSGGAASASGSAAKRRRPLESFMFSK